MSDHHERNLKRSREDKDVDSSHMQTKSKQQQQYSSSSYSSVSSTIVPPNFVSDDVLSQLAEFLVKHIHHDKSSPSSSPPPPHHQINHNNNNGSQHGREKDHEPPCFYEIEGKLGIFIDYQTGKRLSLPVNSETVLKNENWYRFESDMTMNQHRFFNQFLNDQVQASQGALKYKHTKMNDLIYGHGSNKVRVTVDQKTGQVIPNGVIQKTKVADFNVYRPNHALDFRISVNMEKPAERPSSKDIPIQMTRSKDRLSYSNQMVQIDLTQVKASRSNPQNELSHELEVECLKVEQLIREQKKFVKQKSNLYLNQLGQFLNTVRFLSEKSKRGF